MKLLCVGDVNLDVITPSVKYFPLRNEQLIVDDFKWFLGGSAAITSCSAAFQGVDSTLAGCVGNGLIGDMVLSKLASFGVTPAIKRVDKSTGVTFAVSFENTARSFITSPGANEELLLNDLPSLNGFSHLHVSSFYQLTGLKGGLNDLFTEARDKGLTVSFDPGFAHGANPLLVKKLIPLVDVLFLNEFELKAYGGALFCAKKAPIVAVHVDNQGSTVHFKGRKFDVPVKSFKVSNPTGAGDAFNGGFIKEFMLGSKVEDCLKRATDCAVYYMKQKNQSFLK